MKYKYLRNSDSHLVTWPGSHVQVSTEDDANALAEELNRLEEGNATLHANFALLRQRLNGARAGEKVQVEAKNKALRRVSELEKTLEIKRITNERLGKRLSRMEVVSRVMLTALKDCQQVLANHIEPHSGQSKKETILELLDILDQGDLVVQVREASQLMDGCAGPNPIPEPVSDPGTIYAAEIGEAQAPAVTYSTVNHFAPVLKRKERAAIEDALDSLTQCKPDTPKRLKKLLKRF